MAIKFIGGPKDGETFVGDWACRYYEQMTDDGIKRYELIGGQYLFDADWRPAPWPPRDPSALMCEVVAELRFTAELAPKGALIQVDQEALRQLCNGWLAWSDHQ